MLFDDLDTESLKKSINEYLVDLHRHRDRSAACPHTWTRINKEIHALGELYKRLEAVQETSRLVTPKKQHSYTVEVKEQGKFQTFETFATSFDDAAAVVAYGLSPGGLLERATYSAQNEQLYTCYGKSYRVTIND